MSPSSSSSSSASSSSSSRAASSSSSSSSSSASASSSSSSSSSSSGKSMEMPIPARDSMDQNQKRSNHCRRMKTHRSRSPRPPHHRHGSPGRRHHHGRRIRHGLHAMGCCRKHKLKGAGKKHYKKLLKGIRKHDRKLCYNYDAMKKGKGMKHHGHGHGHGHYHHHQHHQPVCCLHPLNYVMPAEEAGGSPSHSRRRHHHGERVSRPASAPPALAGPRVPEPPAVPMLLDDDIPPGPSGTNQELPAVPNQCV